MSSIGDWDNDLTPYRSRFYLRTNTLEFRAPSTKTRQVLELQGQIWIATLSFRFSSRNAVGRRKAQRLEALIDKLRGRVNTVNIYDFANCGRPLGPRNDLASIEETFFTDGTGFTDEGESPTESPGESPTVITAFAGGESGFTVYGSWPIGARQVLVTGFPQNSTQLYAGDNIQVGSFLYRLTEDATSNGLNRAYLSLNRPLLQAIAHGSELITNRPRTPMSLLDDDQTARDIEALGQIREYTLTFEESLFFLNEEEAPADDEELEDSPDGSSGESLVVDGFLWTLG